MNHKLIFAMSFSMQQERILPLQEHQNLQVYIE